MKGTRILAVLIAAVLAGGLLAGPAQASAERHKKRSHIGLSVAADPSGGWDIQTSLKRGGVPTAGALLIIQSKVNGKWKKVRGSAIRTDATGLATYPAGICVHKVFARKFNPVLRVHSAGNGRFLEGNSRHFRAPC